MGQARVQTVGSGDMIRTPQPVAEVAHSQSTPTNWKSIAEGGWGEESRRGRLE